MKQIQKSFFPMCTALLATLGLAWSPDLAQARDVINVSPSDDLVAVVQTPGVIVKAAPGLYSITSTLMLAADTDLIGSNEMVDSDGDGVPDPLNPDIYPGAGTDDFVVPGTETMIKPLEPLHLAAVIDGDGWNRVAQLTVVGPVGAFTALVQNVEEVTDCLLDATPGPGARNDVGTVLTNHASCVDCNSKGTLRGNVIRDCQIGAAYGNNRTTDAQQKVNVSGNRFYRNTNALTAANQAATTSEISIVSIGNIAEQHSGAPYAFVAGQNINHVVKDVFTGSQGCYLTLNSVRDVFRHNSSGIGITVAASFVRFGNGPGVPPLPGGRFGLPNNDNQARLNILNATLENSLVGFPLQGDINLFGAFPAIPASAPPSLLGTNNVVEALIRRSNVGEDTTNDLILWANNPPGSGNDVVLIGSDIAHVSANDPLLANIVGKDFCDFFNADAESCQ